VGECRLCGGLAHRARRNAANHIGMIDMIVWISLQKLDCKFGTSKGIWLTARNPRTPP